MGMTSSQNTNWDFFNSASFALVAVMLVLAGAGLFAISFARPLTHHMGSHILAMNVIAPLIALLGLRVIPDISEFFERGGLLAAASTIQVIALWLAHTPAWLEISFAHPFWYAATHFLLFGAAALFWTSVFSQRGARRAFALLALLIAGKLFCLLGALLVFSPRTVYAASLWEICAPGSSPAQLIADQQLAGLLMLTACPLSYVAAGVSISSIWLSEMTNVPPRSVV